MHNLETNLAVDPLHPQYQDQLDLRTLSTQSKDAINPQDLDFFLSPYVFKQKIRVSNKLAK